MFPRLWEWAFNKLLISTKDTFQKTVLVGKVDEKFYVKPDITAVATDYNLDRRRSPKKKKNIDIYKTIETNDFLIVQGEAGYGKSRLMFELVNYY